MTAPHHGSRGGFRNPWNGGTPGGLSGVLKWKLVDRFSAPRRPDADPSTFKRATPSFDSPNADAGEVTVTWVGHATFLLQIGALNILTDPIWSERASPVQWAGPRRWVPPGVAFDALPPIDVVLQSHNHYDHLDDGTVRRLTREYPDAQWLVPLGVAPFIRNRGARLVSEQDWWSTTEVRGIRFGCTPAQHFSARGFRDRDRTLWCGWALLAGARRIYFCGDSGYHPEFAEIGARFGPFDIALLPIGAYDPRWFMRPVHMNPLEAVTAFRDLHRPHGSESRGVMVPMHWGTFKLTDEPLEEPPVLAEASWKAAGLAPERFWRLAHGQTRRL